MNEKCCWIIRPASPSVDAIYYGKPTRYTMQLNDDNTKTRRYDRLCPEHKNQTSLTPDNWADE